MAMIATWPIILPDFLTDSLAGCGFVSGDIPDLSNFRAAQAAQGLFFSPCLHNQEKGLDIINRWARISNSWMYWSGTSLVVVPLADTTITGNGYTFTPDLTPVYDLGPDDFISNPPVQVDIKDPADCHSRTTVSITDRTMGYATNPIEYKSQSLIRKYGRRDSDNVQADEICCPAVGEIVAQLLGRRSANLTQTFKFQTKWHFIRLLPGAIVTVTDPTQNLDAVPVRITDVEEDESGNLSFTAEELPTNIGTHHARTVQAGPKPSTPDILIDPGNVNVPAVVEPAGLIAGGKAKVLIAASGGANWGGCNVWLSFDGTSYSQIGTITAPAIQGLLTAGLASYGGANPDVGHTLSVDCTQSQGEPDAVTNADAAALRTLSLVCAPPTTVGPDKVLASSGELLAFGATSATGTYSANLTYLYRAALGTSAGSHSTNDLFTLFDMSGNSGSTIQYDLPPAYIGQPLYVKFQSYNVFGRATQDLSVCESYKYTPTGTGFGAGTGGVPSTPTGLSATGGVQQVALAWNANPSTDNVTTYKVWRAAGPGGVFGSPRSLRP
jgi:hypothetical protein